LKIVLEPSTHLSKSGSCEAIMTLGSLYTSSYLNFQSIRLSSFKNEILLKCVHYINKHTVRKLDDRSYMSNTVKEYLKDELIKR
jgi:hypothetical protein